MIADVTPQLAHNVLPDFLYVLDLTPQLSLLVADALGLALCARIRALDNAGV
ncbi:MAG TPA: hypothetical protein VN717_02875 [Gemmatimonadaceae bacterium]|nr:hypothetical protein [Gemmatimonadaceae bacterium]